jgi:rhodanese-related sulfurtransferase
LHSMLKGEPPPLLIDVRSAGGRESGFIPGSLWIEPLAPDEELRNLPITEEVVIYCACPNEASAAVVAKRLMKAGFHRVRPLKGGIDAWVASGLPLETPTA